VVGVGLGEHALYGLAQEVGLVVAWDDHANQMVSCASVLPYLAKCVLIFISHRGGYPLPNPWYSLLDAAQRFDRHPHAVARESASSS
jgi:hypothetical protein